MPLCTTDGSAPTLAADHYLYRGQCLAMEQLAHVNKWSPTVADGTAAGSYKLVAWRTKLGLVAWRGTVGGRPHAFTQLRSTYRHEADSAIGFQMFNDPAQMGSARRLHRLGEQRRVRVQLVLRQLHRVGVLQLRAATRCGPPGPNPNLPMKAEPAYEWQGFDPATNTATYAPLAAHPSSVNQDYYVSWNNKQAKDFGARGRQLQLRRGAPGRPAGPPAQGGPGGRPEVRPGAR